MNREEGTEELNFNSFNDEQNTPSLKERYAIIGRLLSMVDDGTSDLDLIAEKVSDSLPLCANLFRYINRGEILLKPSTNSRFKTVSSMLKKRGLSPLLNVIINTRRTKIPVNLCNFFPTLKHEVSTFVKHNYIDTKQGDFTIAQNDFQKLGTYALFFGFEALVYLEKIFKERGNQVNRGELSHYPEFKYDIHKYAKQIGDTFNFPNYLTLRYTSSERIRNLPFTHFQLCQGMNYWMGINGVGYLGKNNLYTSKKKLEKLAQELNQGLELLIKENPAIAQIKEHEISEKDLYHIRGGIL